MTGAQAMMMAGAAGAVSPPGPLTITGSSGKTISENVINGLATTMGGSSITVTGGAGPITYSWERTAGSASVTPTNPASPYTEWQSNANDATLSATYKCVATDGVDTVEETGYAISMTHGTPP